MAIYPGENKPADWYLRTPRAGQLYIWWGCDGGDVLAVRR